MTDADRVELLETALIRYVENYGFIEEARNYYIKLGAYHGKTLLTEPLNLV